MWQHISRMVGTALRSAPAAASDPGCPPGIGALLGGRAQIRLEIATKAGALRHVAPRERRPLWLLEDRPLGPLHRTVGRRAAAMDTRWRAPEPWTVAQNSWLRNSEPVSERTSSRRHPGVATGTLGVVPTHVVDSTRALVLRLGCLKLQRKRGLSWDSLGRGSACSAASFSSCGSGRAGRPRTWRSSSASAEQPRTSRSTGTGPKAMPACSIGAHGRTARRVGPRARSRPRSSPPASTGGTAQTA
jgi:hypothetical protein